MENAGEDFVKRRKPHIRMLMYIICAFIKCEKCLICFEVFDIQGYHF